MYAILAYILLLPFALLSAAVIWAKKVSGVLYICTDSLGIFDFMPPFVHSAGGDVYNVPSGQVWLTWSAMLTGVFLLPALIIWLLRLLSGKEGPS